MTIDKNIQADAELRELNRNTVIAYMNTVGPARLERYKLFAEDGGGVLYNTDFGKPLTWSGIDKVKSTGEWAYKCFPDWVWTNIEIYDTQDPGRFWVECDGEGQILFPDYAPGIYRNHFIHSFLMSHGKVKEIREFMNPIQQLRALGIKTPEIKRGGFPG